MTNEEAIKLLSQIKDALLASNSWLPSTDDPIKESFGMAINALTAQPEKRTEERTETHACDCISRQEVIDTVHKIIYGFFSEKDGVMTDTEKTLLSVNKLVCNGVRELSPAQPVAKDINVPINDCISRQAAIDAINHICPVDTEYDCTLLDRVDVRCVLSDLPSAQPERKKGKWIDRGWSGDGRGNSWHEWECSECKHITKGAKWDFCPNCGADMREPEDIPMEYFESGGR